MNLRIGDIFRTEDNQFYQYSSKMDFRLVKLLDYGGGNDKYLIMSLDTLEALVQSGDWKCYPYDAFRAQLSPEANDALIRYMNAGGDT